MRIQRARKCCLRAKVYQHKEVLSLVKVIENPTINSNLKLIIYIKMSRYKRKRTLKTKVKKMSYLQELNFKKILKICLKFLKKMSIYLLK